MSKGRGCGKRQQGGIYLCCGLSAYGKPVDDFILDPPRVVENPSAIGITPVGQSTLLDGTGTTHIIDWVGSEHYANPADFVEEVKEMGVSRRAAKTFDYSLLSSRSTLIMLHSRAWLVHHKALRDAAHEQEAFCVRGIGEHESTDKECCAGLWWHDYAVTDDPDPDSTTAAFKREIACGRVFEAFAHSHISKREYLPAFFFAVPITSIEVIRDKVEGTHEQAYENATKAGLPVLVMDE